MARRDVDAGAVPVAAVEDELVDFVAGFQHDPLGFVLAAFDWGDGELAKHDGPDEWQCSVLALIGEKLRAGAISVQEAVQIAVASGHGIGKSALVSWVILWAISTFEDTKGVVTANTENQLKTKTWAELAKWYRLCLTRDWFELTATALFARDPKHSKTWRIDMVPWSENNTEAFAGLHNAGKRVLIVFDEASSIANLIWEVTEGALTDSDTEIIWCCFGNPTMTTGRFRDCFDRFSHRWSTKQIDSRTVKMTNKAQIQKWIDDYGDDSDFVRVRVRGLFPRAGSNALLGPDEIREAMKRVATQKEVAYAPVVLGVDVARQGDDASAIARRQGVLAYPLRELRIPDTMLLAVQVGMEWDKHQPDGVFVDGTGGYGAGVVDALRLANRAPIDVQFGGSAPDNRYANMRSWMYFELAKWVRAGGVLPHDDELAQELAATKYTFSGDRFKLVGKDEIKLEIGRSPDRADALALTFAFPVQKRSPLAAMGIQEQRNTREHDPYA